MIRSTHLPRLIFLQGPPQCGKDTIAALLADFGNYRKMKFAQPIVDGMHGVFPSYFTRPDRDMESFKRHDFGKFWSDDGRRVTGRDVMIAYSESFLKPLFGPEFFGNHMARSVETALCSGEVVRFVISDSGFEPEAQPVFKMVPHDHCAIIQVYRPLHSFDGDSRSYWADPKVATFSYNNALNDLEAMKIDFIKWFNSVVFSYHSQSELRSKSA